MAVERLSDEDLKGWRESIKSPRKKGHVREVATAWEKNQAPADEIDGDQGTLEVRKPVGHQEARVTVSQVVDQVMGWMMGDAAAHQMAVAYAKARHPDWFKGNYNEDVLVRKHWTELVQESTRSAYINKGWDKPILPNVRNVDGST